MKPFRTYIGIFIILFFLGKTFAQQSKVDEARTNFISQKLQLSPSESKNFWPVYNEFTDKMKSIRKERKKLMLSYNYSNNPAEAEAFVSKSIQLENLENQIRTEYYNKFKQIIGVVKTAHLIRAEEEFRTELIKILKTEKPD